jgi:hypothetical protein
MYYLKMKKISYLLLLLVAVISTACAEKTAIAEKPKCVSEKLEGTTISWGLIDNTNNIKYGYILQMDATLNYFTKSLDKEDYLSTPILKMDNDKFCSIFHYAQFKLSQNQVLYTPGNIQKFIEYDCPKMDLQMRGVWNPQYTKNGSDRYTKIFDSLMTLVPNSHKLKSKILKPVEIIKEEENFVSPIK